MTATTPASEWRAWQNGGPIEPGHFWAWADDMGSVRAWFLEGRRSPKVVMKDEIETRMLIYNLRKGEEGFPGVCYVHSMPAHSSEMEQWLARLNIEGLLQYRGEGLPSLSLKVLQTLVKRSRERVWVNGEEKAGGSGGVRVLLRLARFKGRIRVRSHCQA